MVPRGVNLYGDSGAFVVKAMITNESAFAKALMNSEKETDTQKVEWYPEVHYNHYGARGSVDLVEEKVWLDDEQSEEHIEIYELKTEAALEEVTGANEIIRQFNRHADTFFDGSDFNKYHYDSVVYWLLFYATESTIEHVMDNMELYQSCEDHDGQERMIVGLWHEEIGRQVTPTVDVLWEGDINAIQMREVVSNA